MTNRLIRLVQALAIGGLLLVSLLFSVSAYAEESQPSRPSSIALMEEGLEEGLTTRQLELTELTVEAEEVSATEAETSTLALVGKPATGEPLKRKLPPGETKLTIWVSATEADAEHAQLCVHIKKPEVVECSATVTIASKTQIALSATLSSLLANQTTIYNGILRVTAANAKPLEPLCGASSGVTKTRLMMSRNVSSGNLSRSGLISVSRSRSYTP